MKLTTKPTFFILLFFALFLGVFLLLFNPNEARAMPSACYFTDASQVHTIRGTDAASRGDDEEVRRMFPAAINIEEYDCGVALEILEYEDKRPGLGASLRSSRSGRCVIANAVSQWVHNTDCTNMNTILAATNRDIPITTNRGAIDSCDPAEDPDCLNENPIVQMLRIAVAVLSGAIGIIATIVIVVAGIQYSSAGGNPNATAVAKKRILNAIVAIVAWILLFAAMTWLVP